jgi:hypothetical protein
MDARAGLEWIAMLAIAIPSLAAAPGASFAASPQEAPRGVFDWCAPVVSDPLRRWSSAGTCSQPYRLDEIAAGAEVVMMEGSELPEQGEGDPSVPGDPCALPASLVGHSRYLRELRARAGARARPLLVTLKTRFDLVGPRLAARPGFSADFLVRTRRPWSEVLGFFADDRSPDCAKGGCRLEQPEPAGPDGDPRGLAPLFARIEASGGADARGSRVYYLERGSPGKRVYRVTNVLADLSDPAYRAFRVAEARRVLALGGYDAVMLNQKFHQYRSGGGHWIASAAAPDVTRLNRLEDTLWTAPPDAYGYARYVAGWHALAAELRAAAVPYAVSLSLATWRGRSYDDPGSPADESALIREAAKGARLVLLDWPERKRGRDFAAARTELEAAGVRVVAMDGACGQPGARLGGAPLRGAHPDAPGAHPDSL